MLPPIMSTTLRYAQLLPLGFIHPSAALAGKGIGRWG